MPVEVFVCNTYLRNTELQSLNQNSNKMTANLAHPSIQFFELDSETGSKWTKGCSKIYDEGCVRVGNINGVYPRTYLQGHQRIQDFQVFDDDIWIVSFPKCGTTWTQEMVWCIENNLDFEGAKKVPLTERFPYFEMGALRSSNVTKLLAQAVLEDSTSQKEPQLTLESAIESFDSIQHTERLQRPRFIKSHLHYSLLPTALKNENGPKIIYVTRNPKDACVSFYHHCCLMLGFSGTLEDFVDCFTTDNVTYAPFWTHLREFWEVRNQKNVLFLKYEDMKMNLPSVIKQTAHFLRKSLTELQVKCLENHLSFECMKNNPAVNYDNLVDLMGKVHGSTHSSKFMRKGKIGSWKDEMSPEMIFKLDTWIAENKIEGLYEA